MKIIHDINEINQPIKNPVLTIGNFDGVHKGHMSLFDKVKEQAKKIDGTSVVMTFDPHPLKVMNSRSSPPIITPTGQKLELIARTGIDLIICIKFTLEFASITARDFIKDLLVERLGIKEIVVGYDYSFGYKREGNIELLRELGKQYKYKVHVVSPVMVDNILVSSTTIRKLIKEGKLSEAKLLLGRDYQISGTVIKGKNRGARLLGFPTANLKIIDELIRKNGVYAVKVILGDRTYPGVTNIGFNPTFHENTLSIETHILDFSGDILGRTMRVDFIERLRDEKSFENLEQLARQISRDIANARDILTRSSAIG
jgi:riboflavin kinase/FMN adenylyltransferase